MCRTSFLMAFRDAEPTLPAAIASILGSTDPDFEVVLVDDRSVDRSAEIASSTGDPRVRVLRGPGGFTAALSQGLGACRGRFIARMDADDRCLPQRLERQIPVLEADPGTAVVDGQVRFVREGEPVPEGMRRYERWINRMIEPADFDRELLLESPIVHPCATVRRAALDAVGGYRAGDFPEDYDLWLRLHAAGWRLRKVPEVLIEQRDRPERLTRTDPRYRVAAFDKVRREWLSATALSARRRVVLIGAGKRSRSWLGWLRERHEVAAIVDVRGPRPPRHGIEVIGPEGLGSIDADVALAAVGATGAHDPIRRWLGQARPDWAEGRQWWFV